MPALDDDEKDLTMMTMLELKGKGSKKQKEQHQGGKLFIKKAPFKYGRFADAIEARSGVLSCRSNAFAAHDCQERALRNDRCFKSTARIAESTGRQTV